MERIILPFLVLSCCAGAAPGFRPPAVPLVAVDPYMSVWSYGDDLYDGWPVHWTGHIHAMSGMVRVDGKAFRFMGTDAVSPDAALQRSVEVRPVIGGIFIKLLEDEATWGKWRERGDKD